MTSVLGFERANAHGRTTTKLRAIFGKLKGLSTKIITTPALYTCHYDNI